MTNEDPAYLQANNACLMNYRQLESETNVAHALEIAYVLNIDWCRPVAEKINIISGKLNEMLKELIAVCKSYCFLSNNIV